MSSGQTSRPPNPRRDSDENAQRAGSNQRKTSTGNKGPRRPSGGSAPRPQVAGTETSMHAPAAAKSNQPHRRTGSDASNRQNPPANAASASPVTSAAAASSTLNPQAGGFHPGGLSSLQEVQHEVLITPTAGNFDFNQPQSLDYAALTGGMNQQLATQLAQLQQLQLMQQTLNQAQVQQTSNPAQLQQTLELQSQLLAQMQAQTAGNSGNNVPPRFMAQQNQEVGTMMAEQMVISQQLELLRAQQESLMSRFAQVQPSPVTSPQMPSGTAASSFANAARSSGNGGGHRRYQSQQVSSTANQGGMNAFAGMPGAMGQFSQPGGLTYTQPQMQQSLPKGHGRRHSVNVVGKPSGPSAVSPPMQSNPLPGFGSLALSPSMDFASDLDFGASPTLGNVLGSPVGGASASGWVPGHRSRDSRGSISSLSGWGTNSGQYVQNAVPSATTTDLAQATAQLAQLSQFRASAGHAKVPSFGNSSNFYGNQSNYNQQGGTPQQQRKSLFAPYLPAASIPPLVAAGKLVIGALRVNKRNRSDAYVASDALDADIYICGSKDRNRALEGDIVAIELLDVDEVWGTKKEKEEKKRKKEEIASYDPRNSAAVSSAAYMRKQDKKNDDVEVEGQGMTLFDDLDEQGNTDDTVPQYAGHVVGVVHRTPGQLFAGTLGVLRPSSAATKEKQEAERREREGVDLRASNKQDQQPIRIVWLRPVDKRVPLLAIPVNEAPPDFVENPEKYVNRLFCACIKRWPITSLHPFGTLVEEIGTIGDIETETSALLKDANFSTAEFAEQVIKCLPPIPYSIPPRELEIRRDFREARLFTIDPSTARDLDDALSITRLESGNYEVGVHIADVSFFVKLNVALDREARKRGTTVYLVQRAIHMLPQALVEVCSLTPGEDKLAFSVVFTMTPEARLVSTWIGKTVVRSCGQLSYDQVQKVISGEELDAQIVNSQTPAGVKDDILDLAALARQMTESRFQGNALKLDKIKLTFDLDESGQPIDCHLHQQNEAQRLIEEFMLLANISVAQKTAAGLPEQALLRRHEGPIERRLEAFGIRSKRLGYEVDIASAGAIQRSFTQLQQDSPKAKLALQMLITKTMKSAKYFCSGMLDIAKFHHYCLNVPLYTHFTSPIRRYADIMVHRQLEAILLGTAETKLNLDSEAVAQVAQQCNSKREASRTAQESSQHLFLCVLIHRLTTQYGPVIRPAQVIAVLDEAFDVVVPDFGIEKRVHVDQMPIENHVYDGHNNALAIYWKKGVNVVKWLAEHSGDAHLQLVKQNAERHAKLLGSSAQANDESALFDDDEDAGEQPSISFGNSQQAAKSAQKAQPVFEGVEVSKTGHHIQTIRELQEVPVIVSADLTKSPPVIKVLSLNPFP